MAQLFTMPQLGSTMEEGLVVLWTRKEGEAIRRGDPLLEVETDKTIVEVAAPCDGVIHKILAQPDMRVPIHQPLAILGPQNDDISPLLAQLGLKKGGTGEQADTAGLLRPHEGIAPAPDTLPTGRDSAPAISPRARRMADENHIPLTALVACGTGPGGRVIERDVLAYLEGQPGFVPADPLQPATPDSEDDPPTLPGDAEQTDDVTLLALGLPGSQVHPELLSFARIGPLPASAAAGRAVSQARAATSPLTMTLRVDMTACVALRSQLLAEVVRAHGAPLTYTAIVVKSMARALSEHLALDAALIAAFPRGANIDIDGAVLSERALASFVVRGSALKSLGVISAEIDRWTGEARAGKLRPDEIAGNAFRIIDLSASGIESFAPPFVGGNAAVLGMGHIGDRAVIVGQQMVVRPTLDLCLAYESGILDTFFAVRLLQRIKELLEAPLVLLVS